MTHAALDLVSDGADGGGVEAGGVVEFPVFVAFPGKIGHASPQPMVMTTSAARTVSSVHGLGNSWEMSMPRSAIAATTDALSSLPGSDPPDQAIGAGQVSGDGRCDVRGPV